MDNSEQEMNRSLWARGFKITATGSLVASVLVHVLTYFGVDITRGWNSVYVLHFGVFVVFLAMIFYLRRNPLHRTVRSALEAPRWVWLAIAIAFAYAIYNFNHTLDALRGADAQVKALYGLRAFSGHWIVFYLVPSVFFVYIEPGARRDDGLNGRGDR